MRRAVHLAGLLFLLSSPAPAAEVAERWEDGLCRGTLRHDPSRTDAAAVRDTVRLVKGAEAQSVPLPRHVATPRDLAKVRPGAFEAECSAALGKVRSARLLPLQGMEALRQARAAQVEDACQFGEALVRGYADPSALRSYAPAAKACGRYVDALEGKADLAATWHGLVGETCARNADPARCRKDREAEAAAPDGADRMRLFVLGFGWNNCATKLASFNGAGQARVDALREAVSKRLDAAYRVTEECDPD